jgi:hypothetical protein
VDGAFDGSGTNAHRFGCGIEVAAFGYLTSRFESLKRVGLWQVRRYLGKDG